MHFFGERAERRSMDGAILYFSQLFIFETINYAEQPLGRSRFDNRTSAILDRQPVSKRNHRGIFRFSLKPQNAPQKKPKPKSARAKSGNLLISASALSDLFSRARRRNSQRVTSLQCAGRSTAQTSSSEMSARSVCTRSGSA